MSKTVKIAIDAMGGEDAPMKNIEGVRLFISKNNSEDFFFNIYGNETLILKELEKNKIKNKYYKIFHTEKKF